MSLSDAALARAVRIGVDTGGTFTDFVCVDAAGRLRVRKLRSTPSDPASVILAGIAELMAEQAGAAEVTHGSTVATNAVLERKGARIAMVITAGFEDVLRVGRQTRAELYNFMVQARRPLVEPGLTRPMRFRRHSPVALSRTSTPRTRSSMATPIAIARRRSCSCG